MQSWKTTSWLALACLIGFAGAATLPSARAQAASDPQQEELAAELVGAVVYAVDGTTVGEIAAVTLAPDGEFGELRMTAPARLGIGERTVVIPRGRYIALRGAVVLDLSPAEVDALASRSRDGASIWQGPGAERGRTG